MAESLEAFKKRMAGKVVEPEAKQQERPAMNLLEVAMKANTAKLEEEPACCGNYERQSCCASKIFGREGQ